MKPLTLPIYTLSGKETGTISLDAAVFSVPSNPTLLHQAVTSFLANSRTPIAHTKDRAAIRGGGKKPWRQKGTGNARAGSTRSPLWRGGGVTFGPSSERNFSVRMPQKMRHAAMRVALSLKAATHSLMILDSLESLDGKTKTWVTLSNALPQSPSALLVIDQSFTPNAERSIRNVPKHKYATVDTVTIYDLVRFPVIAFTEPAVATLTERLAPAHTAKKVAA